MIQRTSILAGAVALMLNANVCVPIAAADPIVIDAAGGQSFNRAVLGQNAFANPYISENRAAGYDKLVSLFSNTSLRGVAGGSSANSYNWKTRVDEYQTFIRPDNQRALGQSTLELLRAARDSGSEMIITVNDSGIGFFAGDGSFTYTDTSSSGMASLAKDWVRYTNHIVQTYRQGDVITDPEDLRILNEIGWSGPDFNTDKLLATGEAAVPKVTYWEIGNEVEYHGTASNYRSRYRTITQAMLQADSAIKVGPNVIGAANPSMSQAHLNELLRFRATQGGFVRVDFISYHPYAYQVLNVDESDRAAVSQTLNDMKANQLSERDWIRDRITNAGRSASSIELMSTEWNPSSWDGYPWHARQYNALGVVETAMSYAEMGLSAAHFWVWPADIHTGTEMAQYKAFKALIDHVGDTLVDSYEEENLRLYVTRNSATGEIAVWGLNFAFGDDASATRALQLSLATVGIDDPNITMMRLADLNRPTTLMSRAEGTALESMGWITSDLTGANLNDFTFTVRPAEISLLLIQVPEPSTTIVLIAGITLLISNRAFHKPQRYLHHLHFKQGEWI